MARRPQHVEQPEESFGHRLARLRRERGITQVELARMLGIRQPDLSDYERDDRKLHAEMVVKLVQALGVTAEELLGLKEPPRASFSTQRRFLRRLRHVDRLSQRDQNSLLRTLDAFLERAHFKSRSATQ